MPGDRRENPETGERNNCGSNGSRSSGRRILSVLWKCFLAYGVYSLLRYYWAVRLQLGRYHAASKLWTLLMGESREHFVASIAAGLVIGLVVHRRRLKKQRESKEEEAQTVEKMKEAETPEEEYVPPTYRTFGS